WRRDPLVERWPSRQDLWQALSRQAWSGVLGRRRNEATPCRAHVVASDARLELPRATLFAGTAAGPPSYFNALTASRSMASPFLWRAKNSAKPATSLGSG